MVQIEPLELGQAPRGGSWVMAERSPDGRYSITSCLSAEADATYGSIVGVGSALEALGLAREVALKNSLSCVFTRGL